MVGDEITIEATELVAGGEALARIDGLPLFVANVYPGDVARVRVTEAKKGFARAELIAIEKPSALRRATPCPIADECGGCDWTALRLDAQLAAKERILTESLRRVGKFDVKTLPPISVHPSPLNYRLRSRLHRDGDVVGFYATGSHRVVPLARECEVVGVETATTFGSHLNTSARPSSGLRPPSPEGEGAEGRDHPSKIGGVMEHRLQPVGLRKTPAEAGAPSIWEVDGRLITEGELTIAGYQLSTESFFQVNRHLLGTMLQLVRDLAARASAKESAVDLYAGVGFFSVPLAESFAHVTSVEGARASHEYAKRNVPANVELVHAAVEQWVERMPRADLVFLDPPRSGAKRNVIDAIATKTNAMICFLACDPVTFARDASRLTASGWRLASLDLLDLFPNTHHVETLASFERAG
jgi:23S rRNA (uracil1939-C5)-methyltransferase